MAETALILNPHAGRGKAGRLFPLIEKNLRAHGLAFDVHETTGPGHATEICRAEVARGAKTVIAAGGDGTIREIVNAIGDGGSGIGDQGSGIEIGDRGSGIRAPTPDARHPTPFRRHPTPDESPSLGVVPVGSGNDFIKSVGIPRELDAACAAIAGGKTRTIDLIRVGSEKCANAVGIGFDALVVIEATRVRWLQGLALYLAAVLKATMRFDCPRTTIELDGRRWTQSILMIACANGHHFGGGFHIAPDARVDDGLLDICVIDAVRGLTILQKLLYVIRGTHAQLKEVKFYRARQVRLTSPDILYVEADGDLLPEADPHSLEIEVLPAALRLIVP